MTRFSWMATIVVGIAAAAIAAEKPFYDLRTHQTEYAGPGRDSPDPTDVDEIRIGYFGPSDPAHSAAGDAWCAAQLAIDEANRAGGYRGKPFRLVPGWSDNPWKGGAAQVTRMVYVDHVWAIVGGIDSASTHLAEQVVAKARLPLVSPGSTDRTANMANVPWMFSCLPGDHLQAPVLADALARRLANRSWVAIQSDDHDSRQFMIELDRALAGRRIGPSYRYTAKAADTAVGDVVAATIAAQPEGILIVAADVDSIRLVAALRQAGFRGDFFGGPSFGRRRFLEQAKATAEGAFFPLVAQPGPAFDAFRDLFRQHFQREPDFAAAGAYDAVRIVVAGIHTAGLNRRASATPSAPCPASRALAAPSAGIRWEATAGRSNSEFSARAVSLWPSSAGEKTWFPKHSARPMGLVMPGGPD